MRYQNVQPYFFLSHCAKLQEKVEEMFNLVDANSDGKVTLAEMQDDTLDTDPRMAAIWNAIFSNLGGDEFQKKGVKSSSGDEYNEGRYFRLCIQACIYVDSSKYFTENND